MQSSGGILSAEAAGREAVRTLLSGPAAGVMGAFQVASAAGYNHVITFDMGGTSTDVSLADGAIRRTSEGSVEGWPVRVPILDVHTVGAGGGSIAWADAAGALRVGPQSAGSEPGPACYGRGGTHFTVTDANLLLGRLDPGHFLGGRMSLDRLAAELAAGRLAGQLGFTPVALAEGVIAVANARMEQAIRVVSVERGFDPRGFTLLPFGGAGPMHALELADALYIAAVLAPRYPGVLSALGLVLADFTKDFSQTIMRPLAEMSEADLAAAFEPLVAQAQTDLAAEGFASTGSFHSKRRMKKRPGIEALAGRVVNGRNRLKPRLPSTESLFSAQNAPRNNCRLDLALDLRYRGQSFELTVPIVDCDPVEVGRRFHAAHEQRYGYARPEAAVELVNVRLAARGLRPKPELPQGMPAPSPDPAAAQVGRTRLRFGGEWLDAPVYERSLLAPGHALAGPALIVQEDATTVLIPGWRGEVDPWLNLVCRRADADKRR